MKPITSHAEMVAYCGLYCGACSSFLKERCPGCHDNKKATWCKIRLCCIERGYLSCADCQEFSDPQQCAKFNNFFSKIIGFVLRSDRAACIRKIKKIGIKSYADLMTSEKKHSIRRGSAS